MPDQAAKDTHVSHRRRRSTLPPCSSYPSPSSASSLTRASPSLRPQRPAPSRPPSPGNTSRHSPAAACVSQPAPPASALLAWRPWPSLFRPGGSPAQPAQPAQPVQPAQRAQAAHRDAFLASREPAQGPFLGGPGNGNYPSRPGTRTSLFLVAARAVSAKIAAAAITATATIAAPRRLLAPLVINDSDNGFGQITRINDADK